MPTFNQLIRHGREEKRRTDRTRASDQCPQKKGVGPRLSTRTPKKPNSAPLKVQSMLLVRSFRLLFLRLIGEAVGPGTLILLLCILSSLGGYAYENMEDPARGEGGSGAGSSQRPVLDLNLPPGGRDELSDLVAKLDQVEREIRHLSESRIESPEEGEARQFSLSGLHTVLDEVENLLEQSRQLDGSRDQERARQRAELREPFRLYEEAEALLDARRQALAEASLSLQLQLWAQDQFLQEGQEGRGGSRPL
ncbi:unnamed protein product [Lupinus luteus]|uniref:Uncharacterized protein n=1 Tax=Lupinus luteus TaxID=3873 RepID=A0AAV1WZZ8_LUPLU